MNCHAYCILYSDAFASKQLYVTAILFLQISFICWLMRITQMRLDSHVKTIGWHDKFALGRISHFVRLFLVHSLYCLSRYVSNYRYQNIKSDSQI